METDYALVPLFKNHYKHSFSPPVALDYHFGNQDSSNKSLPDERRKPKGIDRRNKQFTPYKVAKTLQKTDPTTAQLIYQSCATA